MPMPEEAAERLVCTFECLSDQVESGAFVRGRKG
jgi:hypothetical protein